MTGRAPRLLSRLARVMEGEMQVIAGRRGQFVTRTPEDLRRSPRADAGLGSAPRESWTCQRTKGAIRARRSSPPEERHRWPAGRDGKRLRLPRGDVPSLTVAAPETERARHEILEVQQIVAVVRASKLVGVERRRA
jgi:hypothetical protein